MNGDKELASLPIVALTPDDERGGRIARLQAEASMRTGPVLRLDVPSGRLAGPCACLVGRDAIDFACGEGLEMLSSSRGWAPLIGRRFGVAVINRDGPAHREDRRAWAPTFTPAAIERMLGAIDDLVMRRIDAWIGAGTIDAYEASRELGFAAVATIAAGFRDDDALSLLGRQFAQVFAPPENSDHAAHHVRVQPLRDAIERALGAHVDALQCGTPSKEAGLIARLARNEALSKDALLQHLNLLLVTGHETTATLLAWCLLLIAEDLPWRERLRNEASAIGRCVPKAAELAICASSTHSLPRPGGFIRHSSTRRASRRAISATAACVYAKA